MQDYRRQIAYLYTYEHGQPVKNSGFVKAELRDCRCRLGIHLKGYSRKGQDTGKAYIYFCREDTGIGIYLGEMEDRNGVLEWQGAVDPDNIQEKGVRFSETNGIWIRRPGSKDYVAEWQEGLADVSRFLLYPKGGETCIRCPRFGNCKRSMEDVSDKR